MVNIDDFSKIEIKIGKIISAEKVPNADKLLKLAVDFGLKEIVKKETLEATVGEKDAAEISASAESAEISAAMPASSQEHERDIRQIISGIALHFPEPEKLVGKLCPFVTNLEPRRLRGLESNGMIMASSGDGRFSLLEAVSTAEPGDKVK